MFRNAMTVMSVSRCFLLISLLYFSAVSHAKNLDLLVLGDSISSGYGIHLQDNWVTLLSKHSLCRFHMENLSNQGATTQDGITTLEHFYQKHHTRYLLIELGGNDALRGTDLRSLSANLTTLIHLAKAQNATIFLVGVDLPPNYGVFYRKQFKNLFEKIATDEDIIFIQLDFPEHPNLLQEDGIHPNEQGHQAIFSAVSPLIYQVVC